MSKKFMESFADKNLASGLATYTMTSILGPLIVFLGLGLLLDKVLEKSFFTMIGIFLAFIMTNIFVFFKIKRLLKIFEEKERKEKAVKDKENKAKNKENSV